MKTNGGIVLEDFNKGDGFYKIHLDYLNKKQVEEIEELVKGWNEEDEKNFNEAISYIKDTDLRNWLITLKDRAHLHQEWSEEDEEMRLNAIKYLELFDAQGIHGNKAVPCINWLKERVHPQHLTITDEEIDQARKDAYNAALDKIEYHSDEPTFNDGWNAAIWYLRKRDIIHQEQSDEQRKVLVTPEILKKNGFVANKHVFPYPYFEYKNKEDELKIGFAFPQGNKTSYTEPWVYIDSRCVFVEHLPCRFVYQFRQILHLSGIEKEIIL